MDVEPGVDFAQSARGESNVLTGEFRRMRGKASRPELVENERCITRVTKYLNAQRCGTR